MSVNIFEQATRARFRFKTDNGYISTEDLWHVSLEKLDTIALGLQAELNKPGESFISNKPKDATLQARFDVVKHIIDTKLEEKRAESERTRNAAERQVLLAALEKRQQAELEGLSTEDIKKRIAALDKDAA